MRLVCHSHNLSCESLKDKSCCSLSKSTEYLKGFCCDVRFFTSPPGIEIMIDQLIDFPDSTLKADEEGNLIAFLV